VPIEPVSQWSIEQVGQWIETLSRVKGISNSDSSNSSISSKSNCGEFIQCDALLKKGALEFTNKIKATNKKLNYLVLSASPTSGSFFSVVETSDGIEANMAVSYYTRFLIIQELMPLLEQAAKEGEDARVITVLAAGREKDVMPDDMDLKKSYNLSTLAVYSSTYNSLMCQEFSNLHPSVSFIHVYPGFVDTPLMDMFPFGLGNIMRLFAPLFTTWKKSTDFGEVMVDLLTAPKFKTGSHFVGEFSQEVEGVSKFMTRKNIDLLWKHTADVLKM
jgi:NAD(P)-dependent dehydrogenase (short-subunit alcohol dehydrogenase family)